jgi:multiple sugar transport system substrate-binding protein
MSLDVTWTKEFVDQKWLMPLCDWWPSSDRSNYLSIPLQMATIDCKVYAAPLRSDVGLLYYRTDIFPHDLFPDPPATWQELAWRGAWAQKNKQIPFGYVWQGAQYEGLFCNLLEVLGKELDLNDAQGFNAALDALEIMGQWRGTISPPDILSYREDTALNQWVQGSAAFMRNWTYAIASSNDVSNSKVAGKFNIAPLPSGHSCVGGWQLGINAQSSPQKQAAAWTFVKYMLGEDAQQHLSMEEALMPTLTTMYQEPEVPYIFAGKNPFIRELPPLLDKGLVRPVSPCYQQGLSPIIQQALYKALAQDRPEQYRPIMMNLRKDLQQFVCP